MDEKKLIFERKHLFDFLMKSDILNNANEEGREYFFNCIYNMYNDEISKSAEQFDDVEFINYAKEMSNRLNGDLLAAKSEKAIVYKVSIKEYEDNYRIIKLADYFPIFDMAMYSFALFGIFDPCNYKIKRDDKVIASYTVEKGNTKKSNRYIYELELEVGEILVLELNKIKFNVEILDIVDFEGNEDELIEKHGIDIIDNNVRITALANEGKFSDLEKIFNEGKNDENFIKYMKCLYKKKNKKISRRELNEKIDLVYDNFFNIDDNEEVSYDDNLQISKEEYFSELANLPHIKKYEKLRLIYSNVMNVLYQYYNDNSRIIEQNISEYFVRRRVNRSMPTQLKMTSIELNEQDGIMLARLLPLGDGYTSPCELFSNSDKFDINELKMINSLLHYKYGIYEIKIEKPNTGYVTIVNMINGEKTEVIDKSISYFATIYEEIPIVASIIITYDDLSVLLCGQFLNYDDKVKDLILKLKQGNLNVIDLLINTKIIQMAQNKK